MFKYYLTYQFALRFSQMSETVQIERLKARDLRDSAQKALIYLERAIRTKDPKEHLSQICLALLYVRECEATVSELKEEAPSLFVSYDTLHKRLERMCEAAALPEQGQLRLFG